MGTFGSEQKASSGNWYRAPWGWIAAVSAAFVPAARRSERPRLVILLLAFVAIQAVVMSVLLAPSRANPPPQSKLASSASRPLDGATFNALRDRAIMGNGAAGVALVGALLDNYERGNDSNDLLEAVQWMDRGWATGEFQQSGLASRVFEHHCDHRVLRWHPLCDHGE